jgi:2-keto-4-pentenoate hydratase
MLREIDIDSAAKALFQAEEPRKQIGLLSLQHSGMTMDDAYTVRSALVKCKLKAGRKVIGWRIGLTSRAMQNALNIDIPDSGVLFDDMVFEDGSMAIAATFAQRETAIPTEPLDALTPAFAADEQKQQQWRSFIDDVAINPGPLVQDL